MPASDQTVKVTLVAVSGPFNKGMAEASSATSKLGKDLDGTSAKSKGMESSLSGSSAALKGMAAGAAAVAGTALVAFLRDTVRAAGDLEQSVGGVDAVFGKSAKKIHDFGKGSADAVGLSTNEFNKLATVTGALLKNKGLDHFEQKTLDLVKIGADLSATYGGTAKDAIEALNAAMRGESDPIERYGISLNETAVNAELAAKGLTGLTGAALEQAKAQARIDIIMRQSADATGRFASEANTLQGQQQRLNAEWENAKAALGQALLPTLTGMTSALREGVPIVVAVAKAWSDLPGPVQAALAAVAGYVALRGPLNGAMATVASALQTVRQAGSAAVEALGYARQAAERAGGGFKGAAEGVRTFTGGMGQLRLSSMDMAVIVMAEAAAFDVLGQKLAELQGIRPVGLEAAKAAIIDGAGATSHFGDLLDTATGKMSTFDTWANRLVVPTRLFGGAMDASRESLSAYDSALADLVSSGNAELAARFLADAGVNAGEAASKLPLYAEALKRVDNDSKLATTSQEGMARATAQTTQEAEKAADAIRKQASAALELVAAQLSASNSAIAYQQSSASVADIIANIQQGTAGYAATLDLTTEAGRRNQSALNDLAASALRVAEDNLKAGEATDSVKASMEGARQGFIAAAVAMGTSEARAQQMADQFGLTSGTVDTLAQKVTGLPAAKNINITASTSQAIAALEGVQAKLYSIRDRNVTLTVSRVYSGGSWENVGQFSTGGAVYGPGTSTSDSIPARLSNGEYVVKAAAVDKYGLHFMDRVNSMRLASGGSVGGGSRGGDSTSLDPATIRAALDGATLRLGPVDSITREVTAQLVTAYSRSV